MIEDSMIPQNCNTKEGVVEFLKGGLPGLHSLMEARTRAFLDGKILFSFCLMGRFILYGDKLGIIRPQIFSDKILASGVIPTVMKYEELQSKQAFTKASLMPFRIPPVGYLDPISLQPWGLRDLHDCIYEEGFKPFSLKKFVGNRLGDLPDELNGQRIFKYSIQNRGRIGNPYLNMDDDRSIPEMNNTLGLYFDPTRSLKGLENFIIKSGDSVMMNNFQYLHRRSWLEVRVADLEAAVRRIIPFIYTNYSMKHCIVPLRVRKFWLKKKRINLPIEAKCFVILCDKFRFKLIATAEHGYLMYFGYKKSSHESIQSAFMQVRAEFPEECDEVDIYNRFITFPSKMMEIMLKLLNML